MAPAKKSELLVVASDAVIAHVMETVLARAAPRKTIRSIATFFNASNAHRRAGAQLSGLPQTALLLNFEGIGRSKRWGVSESAQFTER
jgi:hypothetical protein